jgi:hypothetical protein
MADCLPMPLGAYVPASATLSITVCSGILSGTNPLTLRRVIIVSIASIIVLMLRISAKICKHIDGIDVTSFIFDFISAY